MARRGEEQHHRGHVRHEVRQDDGRAKEHGHARQVQTPRGHLAQRPRQHARLGQRAVDDEQAEEEHEQLPVQQ